jgi:hypothetical protein
MKKTRKRLSEPSAASLRAIPELDLSKAIVLGRGAKGLQRARALLKERRGRPHKGVTPSGSIPRSVRFTEQMWRELERRAKRRGMTLHALLREVIAEWLTRAA